MNDDPLLRSALSNLSLVAARNARYMGVNPSDADDIASIAVLKFLQHEYIRRGQRSSQDFNATFLHKIARSAFGDWLRKRRPIEIAFFVPEDAEPWELPEQEGQDRKNSENLLLSVLEQLPDEEKPFMFAVMTGALEGLEDKEVAARLGLTPSTFSDRKIRAIEKAQKHLGIDKRPDRGDKVVHP